MKRVNVHEANTHLSKLLKRVAVGEKSSSPEPAGAAFGARSQERTQEPGGMRGQFVVPDDFDAPVREVEEAFYNGDSGS